MSNVYFGGSRSLPAASPVSSVLAQVVNSVVLAGHAVHVGCQFGADALVVHHCLASSLVVFAVSGAWGAPLHVHSALCAGAQVIFNAGGTRPPMVARYLLRSLAAAVGCECALFFQPGSGSLAVASRLIGQMPVYAFGPCPAGIPRQAGKWVVSSVFGFSCWQWSPAQGELF